MFRKTSFLFLLALLATSAGFAQKSIGLRRISFDQTKKSNKPFILEGKITNFNGEKLFLSFREEDKWINSPVKVDKGGKFYFTTNKINKPVAAQFHNRTNALAELFIAPGYHLILTGDDKDGSFFNNKKITGAGSTINQYSFFIRDTTNWLVFDEEDLLAYIKRNHSFRDSAYQAFFNKDLPDDEYAGYFRKMALLDNMFTRLNYLICHADDSMSYSYDKSIAFVKEHFNNDTVFNNLYKDEYMASGEYLGMMFNEYPRYLQTLNCKKDPAQCDNKKYWVQVIKAIDSGYTGKIKQRALYRIMQRSVRSCRSFEELNNYKESYPGYIALLGNKGQQAELEDLLSSKTDELANTQIGKAAPAFTVQDSSGRTYSLDDFKGKVVYIDLWGSWCAPCRALTPYFKTLYEKYKNDNRIACISIAVSDKMPNWKKALEEDKPTWLQLIDNSGIVLRSYVAYSVPKFILINKDGNIVSFDTVMPDKRPELEKILDNEIAK